MLVGDSMRMIEHRYDAFISYNHGADGELAPAIERGLQRIAKPWYRLRALSVFRDMSDTGLNPSLWGTVQRQLDGSSWLVLLACPESAASRWVHQEVDHWCEQKSVDTILIVLTGGDLVWDHDVGAFASASSALAPDVARRFTSEPLWLDLRWARDLQPPPDLGHPRFKSAIARLASPLRDLPPDEIESEDLRLHRTARRLARAAVATLVTLAVVASIAAVLAVRNANRAERRAREATARQLGLLSLDLPASDLDRALLLSAAAARLDPSDHPDRFRPSRTLLGRHARLVAMLHTPDEIGRASLRGVAIAPDGSQVAATAWPSGGDPVVVRWEGAGSTPPGAPATVALPTTDPFVDVHPDGSILTAAFRTGGLVAVGRDARRAIVRSDDATMLVDPAADTVLATWTGSAGPTAIAGSRAVVVAGGSVTLADATDGTTIATAVLDEEPPFVAVRDDTVVTVGSNGALTWWRPAGDELEPLDDPVSVAGLGDISALVVGTAGNRALVVGSTGSAMVDRSGTTIVDDVTGDAAIDPSGRYGAVGGTQLTVWDLALGQRAVDVTDEINAMAWSGCDGSAVCRLVTAGESLDVWEPGTGRRIRLSDQTNAQAVDITERGDTVVSAGWGPSVAVWTLTVAVDDSSRETLVESGAPSSYDAPSGTLARLVAGAVTVTGPEHEIEIPVDDTTADRVRLVADANRLVVGNEQSLQLFAATSGSPIEVDARCRTGLWATSPGGEWIAVHRTDDGATAVCSARDGTRLTAARIVGASSPASLIAVDDDGSVALGGAGHIDYVRIAEVEPVAGGPAGDSVAPAPASGARFSASAPAIDVRFGGERVAVTALAVSQGRVVAGLRSLSSPAAFGRVVVWDAATGGIPVQFETDHRVVPAVALLGDDAELMAAAGQAEPAGPVTIQVWEADTRRQLGRGLGGLTGTVTALGGDATTAVATDATGLTYRWGLDLDPTTAVCRIVGRDLTRDEWDAAGGGMLARYDLDPVCGG